MLPTAHQVFASVELYAVIADLQLPVAERDGAFYTPHPQDPEHELQIQGRQFIGSGYHNPTPGGNLFDFLALHFGSYDQGLDFNTKRPRPGPIRPAVFRSLVEVELILDCARQELGQEAVRRPGADLQVQRAS